MPGYAPDQAFRRGRPLRADDEAARNLPPGYDGPVTLLSRLTAAGGDRRALMPIRGHDVEVAPDRRSAVFCAMDHVALLRIDVDSLDVTHTAAPHAPGHVFGGHASYSADGTTLFVAERSADGTPYVGDLARYQGRISVRDAATLAVRETYPAHGIGPHEVALIDDGRYLAIANYGRVPWPADQTRPAPGIPFGVEPSLTVIDTADGRLVSKVVSARPQHELRHLGAARGDRLFAVQVRPDTFDNVQRVLRGRDEVYMPDRSDSQQRGYMPVPLLRFDVNAGRSNSAATDDRLLMQRGQSIVYDPVHDEALAVFTSAHTVVAFDGASGAVKRVVRTDRLGLRLPRGIALLPDHDAYAVSGHWADVFVFSRGRHDLVREASCFAPLFGHSHLAVA
ncbi:MAG: DUF1513 domain-containing protein [Alphaproteobacteria bacterium]